LQTGGGRDRLQPPERPLVVDVQLAPGHRLHCHQPRRRLVDDVDFDLRPRQLHFVVVAPQRDRHRHQERDPQSGTGRQRGRGTLPGPAVVLRDGGRTGEPLRQGLPPDLLSSTVLQ
jgi:hypothetical protein